MTTVDGHTIQSLQREVDKLIETEEGIRRKCLPLSDLEDEFYVSAAATAREAQTDIDGLKREVEALLGKLQVSYKTAEAPQKLAAPAAIAEYEANTQRLTQLKKHADVLESLLHFEAAIVAIEAALEDGQLDVAADNLLSAEMAFARLRPPTELMLSAEEGRALGMRDCSRSENTVPVLDPSRLLDRNNSRLLMMRAETERRVDMCVRQLFRFNRQSHSLTVSSRGGEGGGSALPVGYLWDTARRLGVLPHLVVSLVRNIEITLLKPLWVEAARVVDGNPGGQSGVGTTATVIIPREDETASVMEKGQDPVAISWTWMCVQQNTSPSTQVSMHSLLVPPLQSLLTFIHRNFCVVDNEALTLLGTKLWDSLLRQLTNLPPPTVSTDFDLLRSLEVSAKALLFIPPTESRLHTYTETSQTAQWALKKPEMLDAARALVLSGDQTTVPVERVVDEEDVAPAPDENARSTAPLDAVTKANTLNQLDSALLPFHNVKALDNFLISHGSPSAALSSFEDFSACSITRATFSLVEMLEKVLDESADIITSGGPHELAKEIFETAREIASLFLLLRPTVVDASVPAQPALFFSDCLYLGHKLTVLPYAYVRKLPVLVSDQLSGVAFTELVLTLRQVMETHFVAALLYHWSRVLATTSQAVSNFSSLGDDQNAMEVETALGTAIDMLKKLLNAWKAVLPAREFASAGACLVDFFLVTLLKKLTSMGSSRKQELSQASTLVGTAVSVLQAAAGAAAGTSDHLSDDVSDVDVLAVILTSVELQLESVLLTEATSRTSTGSIHGQTNLIGETLQGASSQAGRNTIGSLITKWEAFKLTRRLLSSEVELYLDASQDIARHLTADELAAIMRLNAQRIPVSRQKNVLRKLYNR